MLNKEKHRLLMGRILNDLYGQIALSSVLGFKGGTCAYLLYGLPRFSVDLDFDLLPTGNVSPTDILQRIKTLLASYGTIKDARIKRYTIFILLSYGPADQNIKIEINTRALIPNIRDHYERKEFLGLPLLAAMPGYLFASKLGALTTRPQVAARDIYDTYYFAKNNWDIDQSVIEARFGKKTKIYLLDCIAAIKKFKDNEILQGLGELLDEQEKTWVKQHLKTETIFLLKNYQAAIE